MTRVGVATDKVTVTNWFSATANRLDFVNFTNVEKTAAEIDALVAGGGGTFLMSAPGLETLGVVPQPTSAPGLSDFAEWHAWSGGQIRAVAEDEPMTWRPIKSFTLGGKAAAEEDLYPILRPIKSFPADDTTLGVSRLIDAMNLFGAERNIDGGLQADNSQFAVAAPLAAGNALEVFRSRDRYLSEVRASVEV